MCLYSWDYAINHIENKDQSKQYITYIDINRPTSRFGHKYSKYKKYLGMILICTKQHHDGNT